MENQRWMTVEEIAKDLRVSEDLIRSYIRSKDPSKRLPSIRVGKEYRIERSEYEEWLKRQRILDEGQ